MDTLRVKSLTDEIANQFNGTEIGHCARVDYLDSTETMEVCRMLRQSTMNNGLIVQILRSARNEDERNNDLFITADQAIEIRNRKRERLCLFVPSDLVDAAYSSLANSFALIDGRKLHAKALKQVIALLPIEMQHLVRSVFSQFHGALRISDDQRLDFAASILEAVRADRLAEIGLELWRVGLITDASPTFDLALDRNRRSVLELARPGKLDATPRERIQRLKVDKSTGLSLGTFFRGRAMHDVREWSQALIEKNLTFDKWIFPKEVPNDIHSVTVQPFVNLDGVVERYCHLVQQDGPGGYLLARCGHKERLIVRWKSDPEQPQNLGSWRIEMISLGTDSGTEGTLDLPEIEVPGHRRNVTFKLDLEFDEAPDFAVCIRVVPLDQAGNEIISIETGERISDESDEFFLVRDTNEQPPTSQGEKRRTVPTIAYGRLEIVADMREITLEETDPQWLSKDIEYFSLRINERRVLNVGLSRTLLELEKQIIAESRKGGCFVLDVDEVRPVTVDAFAEYSLLSGTNKSWSSFWRTRDAFFKRLRQVTTRSVIEAADWTSELANTALRYAQVYRELVEELLTRKCSSSELLDALSVDSILIRVLGNGGNQEESVIVMPTHPLRAAWFASYTQLLRSWETQLLGLQPRERKNNIDIQALRLLVPANVPAFTHHAKAKNAFTFFQNLRFFHGVAMPADVPDPHRRYSDIAKILDAGSDQVGMGDIQPNQLAEHLARFHELHPYTDTLVTTLINPDRGDFFAEAVKDLLPTRASTNDEEERLYSLPALQVTSYVEEEGSTTLQALERLRQLQIERPGSRNTDHFLPGLTTTLRSINRLSNASPPEAHIAIVTDFTRPTIVALSPVHIGSSDTISFSLYGLINRFISQFTTDEGLIWHHRIVTEGVRKPEPHPAGHRYSETLIDLHTSLLNAGGYLLGGPTGTKPVLEVQLAADRCDLLERLHEKTNWVITLDRFFTIDYYDSPNEPKLNGLAQKYVLDYSPEFTEGLGHRMMVTTAWHEETGSLLSQSMEELGFMSIDQSVSRLLHYLKTISGKLALQVLESTANASAAVGLGVVTAWLQGTNQLKQAVLVPVDLYPRLFSKQNTGVSTKGEIRCDLVLIALRRNIVDATFIKVKWRRGRTPLETLSMDMALQMEGSALAMQDRFFNENRVDGALQRSYLANVLRFYLDRSRRYNLFDTEAEASFLEHLTRLEKTGLAFRPSYAGYIVSLDNEPHKPLLIDTQTEKAKITVLTAREFESNTDFAPLVSQFSNISELIPNITDESDQDQTFDYLQPNFTEAGNNGKDNNAVNGERNELITKNSIGDNLYHFNDQNEDNSEIVIPLGESSEGRVNWKPSIKGSPHLFILGIPGQGKSWTTTRILSELGQQHVPALVLDFHGQFADQQGMFFQTAHPSVLDAAKGLPFSPFECSQEGSGGGWKANSYAIAEIFGYVAGLGDMQRDIVFTSIRDAYKAHGFSDEPISGLTYPTLEEVLKRIEQKEQSRHVANVSARCRPLLELDLFQPTENAPNLLSIVYSGLVIDLHSLYMETLQLAAGAFILRKIYKDMFHWGQADRLRLAIVLDEAHRLSRDVTLPKIMKEGRKFGIAVIVASQGLGDFHQDVLSNAGTKIIFRMNYPESRKVSGFIRPRHGQDLASRIEQLPVGSAYVQTPEMAFGSVVHMYPIE